MYMNLMHLRNGQIIAASKPQDLSSVTEGGSHDDGLVAKLFVVIVDLGHRFHTCITIQQWL